MHHVAWDFTHKSLSGLRQLITSLGKVTKSATNKTPEDIEQLLK